MKRAEFTKMINALFENGLNQKDYCVNGLQVQGTDNVQNLGFAVTASQHVINECVKNNIDTLVVHHGIFWNYQTRQLTGMTAKRVESLMNNGINLYAYHLPLDQEPNFGNNVMLAKELNFVLDEYHSDNVLICENVIEENIIEMNKRIGKILNNNPLALVSNKNVNIFKHIKRVGICTGAGGMFFEDVADKIDCFITGEASEQHYHMANELDTHFIAAGHHVTEKFGILELMNILQNYLNCTFIDENNPV